MTSIEKKRVLHCVLAALILIALGAAGFAAMKHIGGFIPCLFHRLTGLRCPGCGNTHAFAALMRLQFAESLQYNYAYPAEYLFLLAVLFGTAKNYVKTGKASYYPKHTKPVYVFLALLLLWGVLRNILGI